MNIITSKKWADVNVTTEIMSLILPQNGVVEGSMHCGSNTSPQFAVGSSIDSCKGNVGPNNTLKRPKILDVSSTNGYGTKTLVDVSDIDNGSLPCSPVLQPDNEIEVSSSPAEYEVLENDTRLLICHFLRDYTGLSTHRWTRRKTLSTMKRVVEGVLEKHRYAYKGMINKLSLDERGDDMSFVGSVAQSIFADGTTNWGRITSLLAFGAVVCQYLKEKGRENCVELVGQEISTYLLSHQRDWLVKNNAWDGFEEFFRVADPESTVRTTLMAFAGFAGIGATLALLIR
nr:induced myeloid leukemia cell differentiation protein Mcl-1-like [Monopterus albus]